jgi:hypothetical protein
MGMIMVSAKSFSGKQIVREPRFEAHLFVLAPPDSQEAVRERAHIHGFRLSSRPRMARDGSIDLLITKNGNDREAIESELRRIAEDFIQLGYSAYRIRLEEMLFDELDQSVKAQP